MSFLKYITFFAFIILAVNAEYECGVPAVDLIKHPSGQRIIGGWEARPHSIPWQIYLMVEEDDIHFSACGGSLISFQQSNSTDLVLTAAHCIYTDESAEPSSADKMSIIAGAHNIDEEESTQQTFKVKDYALFDYNLNNNDNDILLLRLKKPVPYTKYTRPVCLPKPTEELEPGRTCYVSGWGAVSEALDTSPVLLMLNLKINTNEDCGIKTKGKALPSYKSKWLCAGLKSGGSDSSVGDSGGPFVCEKDGVWTQYGVVSLGIVTKEMNTIPIYVRLTKYVEKLKSAAANL